MRHHLTSAPILIVPPRRGMMLVVCLFWMILQTPCAAVAAAMMTKNYVKAASLRVTQAHGSYSSSSSVGVSAAKRNSIGCCIPAAFISPGMKFAAAAAAVHDDDDDDDVASVQQQRSRCCCCFVPLFVGLRPFLLREDFSLYRRGIFR